MGENETHVTTMIHLRGASRYHCDQDGDSATIKIGAGYGASITASAEDFLLLSKTCQEAAKRIVLKEYNKTCRKIDAELGELFPEDEKGLSPEELKKLI